MILPSKAKTVFRYLENAGYECYLVGGCVRDMLMGKEPHDVDITTNATPEETKAVFLQAWQRGFATVSSLPPWRGQENPSSSGVGKQGAYTPPASGLNSNHQQQGLYIECPARATPSQPLGGSAYR